MVDSRCSQAVKGVGIDEMFAVVAVAGDCCLVHSHSAIGKNCNARSGILHTERTSFHYWDLVSSRRRCTQEDHSDKPYSLQTPLLKEWFISDNFVADTLFGFVGVVSDTKC